MVVDNASTDASAQVAEAHGASFLPLDHNAGFAGAINAGVRAAASPLVALLNNDMVVDARWLAELVDAWQDTGAPCIGGAILDWTGEHIDFGGGVVNFHGFGDQPAFGDRADGLDDAVRVGEPFACGGSMLVERELFLECGGLDDTYFAYFEDVDFGWRLNVQGHDVAFTPKSRCMHRHHGTSWRMAPAQRQLLLERNALLTLMKNVDEHNLHRLLGPALMLLVGRVLDRSRSERRSYDPFARTAGSERVSANAIAGLHAIGDVIADLPAILDRRRPIQAQRKRTDEEVIARMGAWLQPIGVTSDPYRAAFANVLALVTDVTPTQAGADARLGGSHGWIRDRLTHHPRLGRSIRAIGKIRRS